MNRGSQTITDGPVILGEHVSWGTVYSYIYMNTHNNYGPAEMALPITSIMESEATLIILFLILFILLLVLPIGSRLGRNELVYPLILNSNTTVLWTSLHQYLIVQCTFYVRTYTSQRLTLFLNSGTNVRMYSFLVSFIRGRSQLNW